MKIKSTAKPIEATPALKGREAEEFIRDMARRTKGKPTKKDMEIFRKIMFMEYGRPRCHHCGGAMRNAKDRTTGRISEYIWKCDCPDFPKDILLMIG